MKSHTAITLHPEEERIAVVGDDPSEPLQPSPILILNHEDAARLAEDLLTWVFTTRPTFQRNRDSLPERLASHMWNCSTIRHGMFSPPQFTSIAAPVIQGFFHKPGPEGASPPGEGRQ